MNVYEQRIVALRRDVARMAGTRPDEVLVARSPYRVCPLGAHVDHQDGLVTGMAIEEALLFGFVPSEDGSVRVMSRDLQGQVAFDLSAIPRQPAADWGDYLRGAAWALMSGRSLKRGLVGIVDGCTKVEGLSSSAAVGVAYLLALECVSDLEVAPSENIELDRRIENDYIGLQNGILDQSMILLSKAGRLTSMDCRTGESVLHPCGSPLPLRVLILHSGLGRRLLGTDYNRRVAECTEAASQLLKMSGKKVPDAPRLRDVPQEALEAHSESLEPRLRRRAEHFFGEWRRAIRGLELWRAGDLAGFGRLVSESGRSSIKNYECGNAYLRSAYRVLCETPGVLGARFSGAGFRGCCIGLTTQRVDRQMRDDILQRYLALHPDMKGQAEVRVSPSADGAGILRPSGKAPQGA